MYQTCCEQEDGRTYPPPPALSRTLTSDEHILLALSPADVRQRVCTDMLTRKLDSIVSWIDMGHGVPYLKDRSRISSILESRTDDTMLALCDAGCTPLEAARAWSLITPVSEITVLEDYMCYWLYKNWARQHNPPRSVKQIMNRRAKYDGYMHLASVARSLQRATWCGLPARQCERMILEAMWRAS